MSIEIHKILPAVRMKMSGEKLKTACCLEIGHDLMSDISTCFSLPLVYLKSETQDDLFNEIESLNGEADLVYIKNTGVIVLANSKAELNKRAEHIKAFINKENYKVSESTHSPEGRVANRIFIITGGAQGFGAGIAESIFNEGGNVVVADLNEQKGLEFVGRLNALGKANKSLFVAANVAQPESVENLIKQTVLEFGGLDVFISNAGILHAGGLDDMTADTFRLMTEVNYSAFFHCAKYSSQIMKIQTRFDKNSFCDILQINSKSGLQGSKKNFAYAGGKFGGIGLTQSFALELMPDHIKVNSICPGNFFEGPLWSDPEKGLFVQYLKAGKVPGAKTIEDVKNFYENQVPAGRGCEVEDVVKAILYAIEQKYETGQAIPVTGGQVMLH